MGNIVSLDIEPTGLERERASKIIWDIKCHAELQVQQQTSPPQASSPRSSRSSVSAQDQESRPPRDNSYDSFNTEPGSRAHTQSGPVDNQSNEAPRHKRQETERSPSARKQPEAHSIRNKTRGASLQSEVASHSDAPSPLVISGSDGLDRDRLSNPRRHQKNSQNVQPIQRKTPDNYAISSQGAAAGAAAFAYHPWIPDLAKGPEQFHPGPKPLIGLAGNGTRLCPAIIGTYTLWKGWQDYLMARRDVEVHEHNMKIDQDRISETRKGIELDSMDQRQRMDELNNSSASVGSLHSDLFHEIEERVHRNNEKLGDLDDEEKGLIVGLQGVKDRLAALRNGVDTILDEAFIKQGIYIVDDDDNDDEDDDDNEEPQPEDDGVSKQSDQRKRRCLPEIPEETWNNSVTEYSPMVVAVMGERTSAMVRLKSQAKGHGKDSSKVDDPYSTWNNDPDDYLFRGLEESPEELGKRKAAARERLQRVKFDHYLAEYASDRHRGMFADELYEYKLQNQSRLINGNRKEVEEEYADTHIREGQRLARDLTKAEKALAAAEEDAQLVGIRFDENYQVIDEAAEVARDVGSMAPARRDEVEEWSGIVAASGSRAVEKRKYHTLQAAFEVPRTESAPLSVAAGRMKRRKYS